MPAENQGLTLSEVRKRLEKFGPNVLPEKPPPSDLSILIAQIKNPLVYVLVAAGLVSLSLRDFAGGTIIFFAVVLNGVLGFFQERRASRALFALKKLIHPEAKVVRDGKIVTIDAANIVPGDVAVLSAGDKIPADGKLIETNRLFVDEAILTGESVPVSKTAISRQTSDFSKKKETADRSPKSDSVVYMGTIIASGQGKMLVEVTGKDTQIGKIALSIQEPSSETPLRKQLTVLSKQLSILVFILTAFVFIVGLIFGRNLGEMFTTSVALSVSAIPEGILVGLTIVLAIGMQRILKKKGLVRNLISAETLGGVTTICIDKTGTLTEGKMRVVNALGDEEKIITQMILANDHDDPIVIAGFEWALRQGSGQAQKDVRKLIKKYPRVDSIPFSSKERFFTSLHRWSKNKNMIFVNGAPEMLLEWANVDKDTKNEIRDTIEKLSSEGKRLIGLARKEAATSVKKLKTSDVKSDLEWIGLLAFSDPVRGGVKKALEKTRGAGIKLIVITGDYPQTAVSVMKQLDLGLDIDSVIMGADLKKMSSKELGKKLKEPTSSRSAGLQGARLFARTTPDQKLKIVDALRTNGEVVAMMGDGVNDAPALNRADIGIVVGEATEVAKESADLVLLDSNFATIVLAIEEGRGIFDNVRKIILYLMSDSFSEIVAVVGTILMNMPLAVTAAQILWINLVSDGFPDMALTVDPKRPGIMQSPPRSQKEGLVAPWMRKLIMTVSLTGGIIALGLFTYYYRTTDDLVLARSIAFAALGINSLVYVFSIRTLKDPFWVENPFDNIWLNISVVAGFALQFLPFSTQGLRDFFGVTSLTVGQWGIVFASSLLMFIIIEVNKVLLKGKPPAG